MELYDFKIEEKESLHLVKGLYGSIFDKSRACAFCTHHRCYLTVKQVRQHNCLGKQCWYLQKNADHDWWRQREVAKQKRKARRNKI